MFVFFCVFISSYFIKFNLILALGSGLFHEKIAAIEMVAFIFLPSSFRCAHEINVIFPGQQLKKNIENGTNQINDFALMNLIVVIR